MKQFRLSEQPVNQLLMPRCLALVCVQEEAWQIQLKIHGMILQQVEWIISLDRWRWKFQ